MLVLSCALLLAAYEQHPNEYDDPVDIFRGVCEGATLVMLILSTMTELYHIYLYVALDFTIILY